MLGAQPGDGVCGTVSSGGTESILLALKTYRDWAKAKKGITKPEMVVPITAHAAFDKAAQYFNIKMKHIPVDSDYKADVLAAAKSITKNTIALVGSAPTFPHGVIDPIRELSGLARERGIGFHTDACLGGFVLPVLLTSLIERFGWRHALAMLGVGAFVLVAPLVHLLVVDRPADLGVHPDGDAVAPPQSAGPAPGDGGVAAILRDRAFWCETLAIGLGLFVYLGFLSNLYPHALATGHVPSRAAALMSVVALCSIAGNLGFGTVADRMDLRHTIESQVRPAEHTNEHVARLRG